MQQLDFSHFQPLNGSTLCRLVSVHPTEPLVALQAFLDVQVFDDPTLSQTHSQTHLRCAIWNRETFELVCEPEGAVALAWNAQGNEMGIVREEYHGLDYDPAAPGLYSYIWERYTWPEQQLLHSCSLQFDTNWPELVVFSPLGDLVLVQWFEAEKSGLHFIGLTTYGDQLLDDADLPLIEHEDDFSEDAEEEEDGRFFVETSLVTAPVFSPDGRFIIFCWQRSQHWWTDVPDDVYVEGDLPTRVGECHVGYVQIIDVEMNTIHGIALFANVPPDWQPSYEGDRSNELLDEPVFIDDQYFQVQLPTGETCVYSVFE